ncbi:MAG: HlyD family secretion protein [Nitrospirae bacterium]|nr:HlyD family secretion protein [Nitrospirota bacterium]
MDEIKQTEGKQSDNHRRKILAALVFTCVTLIGVVTAYFYVRYKETHITTDDAFVEGNIHTIASKISGTISEVLVSDNGIVRKGDLLAVIEPADYEAKVSEAETLLQAEKARYEEAKTRIDVSGNKLTELQHRVKKSRAVYELEAARLKQAEADMHRAENLFKKDALSKERYEKTRTGYEVSLAMVRSAAEELKEAEAAIETQKSIVRQAESSAQAQAASIRPREASLKSASLSYEYTKIYAPADGYVTKKSVEVGNQVQSGQPLMAVVSLDNIHIVANYKETQLGKIRPGQLVEIKVDTYPGKVFKGKVDSIMAGTGAAFSLFPPENATGNFVKVVQRIPVKISLDKDADSGHVLRLGMSVESTVIIQ